MGVFGDLANFAKHVVQGDLKGAVGDIGHGVQDVVGGAAGIIPGIGIASGIVMQVIRIIIAAIIIIAVLWLFYDVVTCAGLGSSPYRRLP